MSALKYWLWLAELRGLNNQTRLALLRHFGTPEDVFYADAGEILLTEGITREQAACLENRASGGGHGPGGGANSPRPGADAADWLPAGGAGDHHPRGEEPADSPDVHRLRPDRGAAAAGAGAHPGAGRPAAGPVAVSDGAGERGAPAALKLEPGRGSPHF